MMFLLVNTHRRCWILATMGGVPVMPLIDETVVDVVMLLC